MMKSNIEFIKKGFLEIESLLKNSVGSEFDRELLKHQVDTGRAEAYQVLEDGKQFGYTIIRQEKYDFVVCCYAGIRGQEFLEIIKKLARKNGFKRVRFHTERKGADKYLNGTGFNIRETVWDCKL